MFSICIESTGWLSASVSVNKTGFALFLIDPDQTIDRSFRTVQFLAARFLFPFTGSPVDFDGVFRI